MYQREEGWHDPLDDFEPQTLLQMGPWDCGVEVFSKIAGLTREELLRELPEAINAVPVIRWEEWLTARGFVIERRQRDEEYTLPCAHLIRRPPHHHWIYEDHKGILDPDPKFQAYSAKLLTPAMYPEGRELTISIIPKP
jgi:hypothetical protein